MVLAQEDIIKAQDQVVITQACTAVSGSWCQYISI